MIQRSYTIECDAPWCRETLTVPARNLADAEETLKQRKWVLSPHRQTKSGKITRPRHEFCCVDHCQGVMKPGEAEALKYQPRHLGIAPMPAVEELKRRFKSRYAEETLGD
jgi:hypothetical protein